MHMDKYTLCGIIFHTLLVWPSFMNLLRWDRPSFAMVETWASICQGNIPVKGLSTKAQFQDHEPSEDQGQKGHRKHH